MPRTAIKRPVLRYSIKGAVVSVRITRVLKPRLVIGGGNCVAMHCIIVNRLSLDVYNLRELTVNLFYVSQK